MNIALILAGGTGTRLGGDVPKQYLEVEGKPIIAYCLETFLQHEQVDKVQIVADEAWQAFILQVLRQCQIQASEAGAVQVPEHGAAQVKEPGAAKVTESVAFDKFQGFSKPGANRQLSIWNGLQDIMQYSSADDNVIVHDAARPLVSNRIITDCLENCKEYDGALTVLPVKDTVYYGRNGKIESLLDRSCLMAGQAPEAFRLGLYYKANERLLPQEILKINGSTEPAILAGMNIGCVDGEEMNFKITTSADLERFQQIISKG